MTTVNQAAFAAMHGVSRPSITKWKNRGWLAFAGDLIDVEASNALLKKHRATPAKKTSKSVTSALQGNKQGNKQGNALGNKGPNITIAMRDGETTEQAASRLADMAIDEMTIDDARLKKEIYLGLLNQLEYEQRSGKLIDLDTAEAVFFEEFRAQRDAWLNWPIRVGPLLAAELGLEADKVTEALNGHVYKHISSLGEPDPTFDEQGS
jgi:hypothetical protein